MRFHLDEHVNHAIARGLRARGIDVTTSTDAAVLKSDDPIHVAYGIRENRVIVTCDADFLRLASRGLVHNGIVYCARVPIDVGEVIRYLELLDGCESDETMRNRIDFI